MLPIEQKLHELEVAHEKLACRCQKAETERDALQDGLDRQRQEINQRDRKINNLQQRLKKLKRSTTRE